MYCCRDKLQFQSKIANFGRPHVFNAPLNGFLLECMDARRQKTRMMGQPDDRKGFKIGLAVDTIPACDGQTSRHLMIAKTVLMHSATQVKMVTWLVVMFLLKVL